MARVFGAFFTVLSVILTVPATVAGVFFTVEFSPYGGWRGTFCRVLGGICRGQKQLSRFLRNDKS